MSRLRRRRTRRHGVLLAVLLLCGCDAVTNLATRYNPFTSFETRCARLPASRVTVVAGSIAPAENDSLSYRALSTLASEIPEASRTYGLTHTSFREDAQVEATGLSDKRGGRACFRPQVRVELTMQPMQVYIASEVSGDACRREVLLEHEMKHVAAYREHLREAVADLERELPDVFGQRVFYARDPAQSEGEMRDRLAGFMRAFMAESVRNLKARQDAVDSPEEYARVNQACGGMPAQ